METDALRWFQLVADGVTVTEVSEIYAVSQPNVSRALSRLERDVGADLFRRSGRLLRLTAAGAAFKRHVDHLIHELDDGLAAVGEVVDPDRGEVTLAFPLSLGTWYVPELLSAFLAGHPHVRFELLRTTVGESGEIDRWLATRRADLEITTHRVRGPGVQWRQVAVEPLLLAVPLGHRLADRDSASLTDVRGEAFVLRRAPSGMREQVLALCRAAGFEPEVAYEVDDLPTVRGFVGAGLGVAVVPAMGLTAPLTLGTVRLLPLTDPGAARGIGLAWLDPGGRLPSAERFRRFVLGTVTPTREPMRD
jgi:LysR family transcriptional activator of glutamate synthase operon